MFTPSRASNLSCSIREPIIPTELKCSLLCSATLDQWLLYDSMRAQLLDPEFATDSVHFMELQARGRAALNNMTC
jgi:hypothetical protein